MDRGTAFEGREALEELAGASRMSDLLLVAIGGCLGAVTRYLVDAGVTKFAGGDFPWATLLVNVTGAFALGVLVVLTVERGLLPMALRPAVGIGFLGAYTTFSTYAVDALLLAEGGRMLRALAYVLASNVLAIAAAAAGFLAGRGVPAAWIPWNP